MSSVTIKKGVNGVKIEEFFVVFFVGVFSLAASGLAMLCELANHTVAVVYQAAGDELIVPTAGPVVFENGILRTTCALGSLMGALLSILLFPTKSETAGVREIAAKFLASLLAGVLFTPIVMRALNITMDLDHLIAMSGFIAFTSVTVLHKSIPILETTVGDWFVRLFERMFGK